MGDIVAWVLLAVMIVILLLIDRELRRVGKGTQTMRDFGWVMDTARFILVVLLLFALAILLILAITFIV